MVDAGPGPSSGLARAVFGKRTEEAAGWGTRIPIPLAANPALAVRDAGIGEAEAGQKIEERS